VRLQRAHEFFDRFAVGFLVLHSSLLLDFRGRNIRHLGRRSLIEVWVKTTALEI